MKDLTPALDQIESLDSAMAPVVARFSADREDFDRLFLTKHSPARFEALRRFFSGWRSRIDEVDFDSLGIEARADWILLRNRLDNDLLDVDEEEKRLDEAQPLMPYFDTVVGLLADHRAMEDVDCEGASYKLSEAVAAIKSLKDDGPDVTPFVALRAGRVSRDLQESLKKWFEFYDKFDPDFCWWVRGPYAEFDEALTEWIEHVDEKLGGKGDKSTIVGDPIGTDALDAALKREMIPYTPEEIVKIADKELAWCQEEMAKVAKELGFDDYRDALEHVKSRAAGPGKQPGIVRDLAREAIKYLEDNDLLTVPELAKQAWHQTMIPAEKQLVSPFFLGGPVIHISYPSDEQTHEQKVMSMRGNNEYFSRATVQHELIPGHHMQFFMRPRHNAHRTAFATCFWIEGWTLYWELLLWDLGFPHTPEYRLGMLFWRSHRAARIKFSLGFHLGQMTPQECVDLLVETVGHERFNAEAEVRRSFEGEYVPLYQAAYMLGGLQVMALKNELVEGGKMTLKQFHDRMIRLNQMPIEVLRAVMTETPLEKGFETSWWFYGDP
ncbi:MAG: DUF885 family protein [Armatimonadetes bacterium]|nr:DUF885 family protein [Armatimonadota bacterium]